MQVGITAIELAETQPPLFNIHPMEVVALMTRSSYKTPSLRDKVKWCVLLFLAHCSNMQKG